MPHTRAERVMKRAELRDRLVVRAEVEAQRIARSVVCSDGPHPNRCHGATVCLCECHDPEEQP
jgi:hypothetical protein